MVSSIQSFGAHLLFAFLVQSVNAQNLAQCPKGATSVTTSSGVQYQICPNTDLQAPSSNIVGGVNSATACLQLCDGTTGCVKAVYDHTNSICHIKGNPTTAPWVASTQYDAIQYVNKVADGSAITACPSQETVVINADGSQSIICPMSDYQVASMGIVGGVADVLSCASLCQQASGCAKAVYDHINSVCHLKGTPTGAPWVVSLNQYDSVRILAAGGSTTSSSTTTMTSSTTRMTTTTSPAASTSIAACPADATTFTMDDGSVYELCPKTDYNGPLIKTVINVLSDWDCLQVCSNTANCAQVVFDSSSFTCYVKSNNPTWVTSTKYNTVRLITKPTKVTTKYSGLGSWSPVMLMPVIPVAAYVVPQQPLSNRVLMFSSWGPDDFSGPTGMTQFADYNYVTGAVSARTITNTNHDMFCPGISSLSDGRIVITGGENAEATSFYDPASDTFVRGPDMQLPRGYQSSATTSSGKVFTIGGSFSGGIGGKNGEIYDPVKNTWTLLPGTNVTTMLTTDAEGEWRTDNHAWLYGWKGESVFQAGPSKQQHWFGTTGTGSVVAAGTRDPTNDAMCGVNVMYDAVNGKIFSTGGSQSYTDSPGLTRSYITTIGAAFAAAKVEQVANMINPRGFANIVVLPDGTSLITGGQKRSLVFTDTDSILAPELFNPVTKTFKQLAPAKIPRNYHSVSLLLADGTVFTGGGGMCPTAYLETDAWCNRAADHPSAEIFSPPYLFNADGTAATRPTINTVVSTTSTTGLDAKVGSVLTVTMKDAGTGAAFSLIRMGSATHSINSDQRRIPLTGTVSSGVQYKIQLPTDPGILIPGYYYLFAMNKAGVPSVAKTIQVHT